jgi:hypothetical protein
VTETRFLAKIHSNAPYCITKNSFYAFHELKNRVSNPDFSYPDFTLR